MAKGRRHEVQILRKPNVTVAGLGAVSPAGPSVDAFWDALTTGESGAGRSGFESPAIAQAPACLVREFRAKEFIPAAKLRRLDPCSRFAAAAARQALAWRPASDDRSGVVLGSSSAGGSSLSGFLAGIFAEGAIGAKPMLFPNTVGNGPASQTAILLSLEGANFTISQQEVSGLLAVIEAARCIEEGRADAMLAGGADEVVEVIMATMARLGILDPVASRPFDAASTGFVPGEGGYLLELARADADCEKAAILSGYGIASDTVSLSRWPSSEKPLVRAVQSALTGAGLEPQAIDLWISSANGVEAVEALEDRAAAAIFAGEAPPVTSVKRLTGEGGGVSAAGSLAAVLAIRNQRTFPALGSCCQTRRFSRLSPERSSRAGSIDHCLVTALASGGACAAAIFSRVVPDG